MCHAIMLSSVVVLFSLCVYICACCTHSAMHVSFRIVEVTETEVKVEHLHMGASVATKTMAIEPFCKQWRLHKGKVAQTLPG